MLASIFALGCLTAAIPAQAFDWTENSPPEEPPFLAQCVAAGDTDHDGDTDLMLGREDADLGVAYFTGDGGAAWTDATVAELPGFSTFSTVVLHDMDADNLTEAFFVVKSPGQGIHFSKRKDATHWGKSFAISNSIRYSSITFARLAVHTRPTLVASPPTGEAIDFFAYNPAGEGSFTRTVVPTPSGRSVKWVAAADFDADGIDEIAAVDGLGALFIFNWTGTEWVEVRTNLPQALALEQISVALLDGDTAPDLLALDKGGAIHALLNRTKEAWVTLLIDDEFDYNAVSAGDVNQDGRMDILAAQPAGIMLFTKKLTDNWGRMLAVASNTGRVFTHCGLARLDNDTWLDFVAIEDGKAVRLFYSRDGAPPGGWTAFQPADWITTIHPDCSIQVLDNIGLAAATARYAWSTNGGSTWSAPATPDVTLSPDGKRATLTAHALPFAASSRDQFLVRFTIEDTIGNLGTSPECTIQIDNVLPGNPTLIYTFRHQPGAWGDWSHLSTIRFSWPAGIDEHSRIAGYSCAIDTSPATAMDGSVEYTAGERDVYSDPLADGDQWYIHLRAVDRAGNLAADTMHVGPFFIDTHAPSPPVVSIDGQASASWPEWWLGHQTVNIYRGGDGGATALGTRSLITRNPISDPTRGVQHDLDRYDHATDGLNPRHGWYVHAVTVDRAGNLSTPIHAGPINIDILNPGGRLALTPDSTSGDRIRVDVTDITDSGESGVRQWRLYYRLQGETDWLDWATYVDDDPEQTVIFTPPDRYLAYELAARFEDNAGRISALTGPRSTRFTGSRIVETEIEFPSLGGGPVFESRHGVKIFKNDEYIGTTDGDGRITVPEVALGDRLTALHYVMRKSSRRRDREELGGDPWAYRLYLTNVAIGNDGTLSGHRVETTEGPIRLTLRRSNTLIGFHLVCSLSWNADGVYLEQLRNRWREASDYLYNVSDGQMFLELVEIYEDRAFFDDGGDARFYFHPLRENASVNGLYSRYSYNNIEFDYNSDARVFIHELGHYGLGLYDEYITHRSDWLAEDATCTDNRLDPTSPFAADTPLSACVMDNQWDATNFCDDLTDNPHDHDTAQHRWHHMPCWGTLQLKFGDLNPFYHLHRWYIRRPLERGGQVPGPDAIPCEDWMRVHVMDVPGGAGYEWRFTFEDAFGNPYANDNVDLIRYDGSAIPMGSTNGSGQIFLYNIYPDDQVCIHEMQNGWTAAVDHFTDLPDDLYDVTNPVVLSIPRLAGGEAACATIRLMDGPSTPPAALDLRPGTTVTQLLVALPAAAPFSEPPRMTLWHNGQRGLVTCPPLAWNAGTSRYEATVTLPDAGEPSGRVTIRAIDWHGTVTETGADFHFIPIESATEPLHWGDSAGDVQLLASENAFTTGTVLMLSQAGGDHNGPWRIVKGPYRIATHDGAEPAAPAGIMLTCSPNDLLPVDPQQLAIHRWDEAQQVWTPLPSSYIESHGEVSAAIDRMGIYAVAAPARQAAVGAPGWLYR